MLTHLKAGTCVTGGQRETLTSRVASCRFPCNHIIPHSESLKMTRSWEKQRSVGPETYALVKFMCVVRNVRVWLESVASANILQLLRDFGWCSVQLLCHTFLLVRVHAVKLLAQISINHILEKITEFVFVILKSFNKQVPQLKLYYKNKTDV